MRTILELLAKNDLHLKPEKCEFHKTEIKYLDLIVSHNEIRMNPTKIDAIVK